MNPNILIVVSDFNQQVTHSLLEACIETLYKASLKESQLQVVHVPGAFELPVLAAKGARSKHWDAVICLGCVIRGETPHFDYVCQEAARGLMQVILETEKPVIFGVLTTETSEQALERAGLKANEGTDPLGVKQVVENKGVDAAKAALQMLENISHWEGN